MTSVIAPCSVDAFNDIACLGDSSEAFNRKGGNDFLGNVLRPLLLKYDVENKLGVQLLHRHFQFEEEKEMLVDYNNCATGWLVEDGKSYFGGDISPTSWMVTKNGTFMPYEFSYSLPGKNERFDLDVPDLRPFLNEFAKTFTEAGFERVLALRTAPPGFQGGLEVTEGKCNVFFPKGTYDESKEINGQSIAASWFWFTGKNDTEKGLPVREQEGDCITSNCYSPHPGVHFEHEKLRQKAPSTRNVITTTAQTANPELASDEANNSVPADVDITIPNGNQEIEVRYVEVPEPEMASAIMQAIGREETNAVADEAVVTDKAITSVPTQECISRCVAGPKDGHKSGHTVRIKSDKRAPAMIETAENPSTIIIKPIDSVPTQECFSRCVSGPRGGHKSGHTVRIKPDKKSAVDGESAEMHDQVMTSHEPNAEGVKAIAHSDPDPTPGPEPEPVPPAPLPNPGPQPGPGPAPEG